jgi:PIN domain nuclease of toxin-antitoxin system
MMVVDTHALLWWALDPSKLSRRARDVLAEMEREGGFASAISIWEIGIKAKRGKLELPISVEEFARRIEQSGVVELLPVDTNTWLRSLSLPWLHADPADRVIVATALIRDVSLLSKDTLIRGFRGVTCVW